MNNARKYIDEQMKNDKFRGAYYEEKKKLDIEFLLDELKQNIQTNQSKSELLEGVRKIENALINA
ncbi:MAG TPA: hypothetical protein PKY56_14105 [Candidatus Kapabacteria bacterium]|nr:hypothetical protein [Candidatus Kapabacteria bacterium]